MTDLDHLLNIERTFGTKLKISLNQEQNIIGIDLSNEAFLVEKILNAISCFQSLKHLDISYTNLSNIKWLTDFPELETLNISGNNIHSLSPLANLTKITSLEAWDNRIENIDAISGLQNIEYLHIGGNKISDVNALLSLIKLRVLCLGTNYLKDLSPLTALTDLQILDLKSNKISNIFPLSTLINLEEIDLSNNLISDLSPIKPLNKIKILNLKWNNINTFDGLENILENNIVDLRGNPIISIPSWIPEKEIIISLDISHDEEITKKCVAIDSFNLEFPPPAIVKSGGNAIKNFLKQIVEQNKDYLFEAKLLIVGEPGAGKTTLSRKLVNPKCDLPDDDDTTRGIEVSQIYFPIIPDKYQKIIDKNLLRNKIFRVNIWDFGGQEIYKSTHRFFLSKRSLYVLIADNRKENDDLNYWLHIIQVLGGDSPLILLHNEKQKRKRDFDIDSMRNIYQSISDVVSVDFSDKDDYRLNGLNDILKHQISSLPHIGDPVPAKWTVIRDAIEKEKLNTISLHDYLILCSKHGISETKDALLLSQYFHDIGVFLHFQDDPLLNKIIFLKPNWATNAVYRVLDHILLDEQKGRFRKNDMPTIWCDHEYELVRNELMHLMKKFFLIYEIEGIDTYIVPEKLPPSVPEYHLGSINLLRLQYAYNIFMPKGIISQFIVRMHQYIKNHDLIWRRGCIIERDGATAEVIERYDLRIISIKISGSNTRDFMTIIAEQIDIINNQYNKIIVDKLIPCNCPECINSENPYNFKYSDIRRRIEKRRYLKECENSFEAIDVRTLINDVFAESNRINAAAHFGNNTNIFISFAHEDRDYLIRLQKHIQVLVNEGVLIDSWDDSRIRAGMIWKDEIELALNKSKIAILLISTDFLASDFIVNNELPLLLKRAERDGITILPLIVNHCRYQYSLLSDYQAANEIEIPLSDLSESEREKVYLSVVDRVGELILRK